MAFTKGDYPARKEKLTNILSVILRAFIDCILLAAAVLLALLSTGEIFRPFILYAASLAYAFSAALMVSLFLFLRLYQVTYQFADFSDFLKVTICSVIIVAFFGVLLLLFEKTQQQTIFSLSTLLLFFFYFLSFALTSRFYLRAVLSIKSRSLQRLNKDSIPVMIVGGGEACMVLMREIEHTPKYHVSCIVDDDPGKLGHYIMGTRIAGTRKDIPALAKRYGVAEILIAMPSVGGETVRELSEVCKDTGCKVKIMPGVYQLVDGSFRMNAMREVSIEDLLARQAVKVDLDSVMKYVYDKVVMVTGGGGSIGSELCRQIAAHSPHHLIILDIYENNAYDIQQELLKSYPSLKLTVVIASVRDSNRMEHIFAEYRPQLVYHAAAHKHVPLMEDSPNEAIKNNVFGTLNTVRLADRYGVQRFVLISTDKAVNPTNVMGATKRICEMIVQTYDKRSSTDFVAVRFGNVLGSNGSVIPLFKKQIAAGGPVCVTHPNIIRYFMTISEAVSLVLQAGAYAKGGEIFVLDMGKPVKILDLAENLIRLSGYEPYKDIDIRFTGLRPGEKLYEEMLMSEEGLKETENKLIHIGKPIEIDEDHFLRQLEDLHIAVEEEPNNARELISLIVPTYQGNIKLKNL